MPSAERHAVVAAVRALVRLFYRRVEVSGRENLPAEGPLLLLANHANGLVDAMIVMAVVPRPVRFVAKSTLWRIPLLPLVLEALGVVPVVRRVDVEGQEAGVDRNAAAFDRLASVLRLGGAVLIFPEGRSHSDPYLSPIKTGAARILTTSAVPAAVVPLGLWFPRKEEFRSDVLVKIGPPIAPPQVAGVDGWTEAIRSGLEEVTLNAASWREHEAAQAVEAIYGESLPGDGGDGLEGSFERQRLLHGVRKALAAVEPEAVSRLALRAAAFQRICARAGLTPRELDVARDTPRADRGTRGTLWRLLAGLPAAALGAAAFYLPYRLVGLVAPRLAGAHRDQLALMKILAGLVLHPLALALELFLIWRAFGGLAAALSAVLLPACGIVALLWAEAVEPYRGRLRGLLADLFGGRGGVAFLRAEREALRAECARLGELYLHNRAP